MGKVKEAHMQAFPFIEPQEDDNIKAYHSGMTMRDEFAKAAMLALLSCQDWRQDMGAQETARAAYTQAEEMLKARK